MTIQKTDFKGLFLLQPKVFGDARGYFMETHTVRVLEAQGIDIRFVQDNQSRSSKGVMRGLHFQNSPHVQTKLIRVLSGVILDVVVDLRKEEPTFGKSLSVEISAENNTQLLVPGGFAHGFIVLSESAEVFYKCDDYYHPELEGGINFLDSALGLTLPEMNFIRSDKDIKLPQFKDARYKF